MYNLYSVTTNKEAIRQLVKAIGKWTDYLGNFEPQPSVFPDQLAPIIRARPDGSRELLKMRWGFPSPPQVKSKITTNVRNTASTWWRSWLHENHRCLVPATSFCEYDWRSGKAVPTWFALDETRPPFCFAGVWRPVFADRAGEAGEHLVFAFLTTEANSEVRPVHDKAMPVLLLDTKARETWLKASMGEALKLQRPAPDGSLKIVMTGSTKDAE